MVARKSTIGDEAVPNINPLLLSSDEFVLFVTGVVGEGKSARHVRIGYCLSLSYALVRIAVISEFSTLYMEVWPVIILAASRQQGESILAREQQQRQRESERDSETQVKTETITETDKEKERGRERSREKGSWCDVESLQVYSRAFGACWRTNL